MNKIRNDNMKVLRTIWEAFHDVKEDDGAAIWTNQQWRDLDRSIENLRLGDGTSIAKVHYQSIQAWFDLDDVRKALLKVEEGEPIEEDEQWDDICYSMSCLQEALEINGKDIY